jgi:hypothetical protein
MIFANTTLTLGVALALVAGIMCGAFALPMKYLGPSCLQRMCGKSCGAKVHRAEI